MAYYAVMKSGTEHQWHTQNEVPEMIYRNIENVEMLQADGHELQHIIDQYGYKTQAKYGIGDTVTFCYSIPMPKNVQVVRWYGDIAKTIIANL